MTLQKWIASKGGAAAVSRLLKIEAPRVRSWVRRDSTPKALMLQKLVKFSRGKLSYDDIINSTHTSTQK